jgi:hypothetical protein
MAARTLPESSAPTKRAVWLGTAISMGDCRGGKRVAMLDGAEVATLLERLHLVATRSVKIDDGSSKEARDVSSPS